MFARTAVIILICTGILAAQAGPGAVAGKVPRKQQKLALKLEAELKKLEAAWLELKAEEEGAGFALPKEAGESLKLLQQKGEMLRGSLERPVSVSEIRNVETVLRSIRMVRRILGDLEQVHEDMRELREDAEIPLPEDKVKAVRDALAELYTGLTELIRALKAGQMEDALQLQAFIQNIFHKVIRFDSAQDDDPQPYFCFIHFFHGNAQFMNEIGRTFSSPCFCVMRGWCGSRTNKLTSDMFAGDILRQGVANRNNPCRKTHQPRRNIIPSRHSIPNS